MKRFLVVAAVLLAPAVLAPVSAAAQTLPNIPDFARVRVRTFSSVADTGNFQAFTNHAVVIVTDPYQPRRVIPMDSVEWIQVREKVSFSQRFGETTLIGVMVGSAFGTVVSFLMGSEGGASDLGRIGPIFIGALGGGMAGTALGKGERWSEVYRHSP